jgi:hypothetical protein
MRQDNRTAHERKNIKDYVCICVYVLSFYGAAELVAACLAAKICLA